MALGAGCVGGSYTSTAAKSSFPPMSYQPICGRFPQFKMSSPATQALYPSRCDYCSSPDSTTHCSIAVTNPQFRWISIQPYNTCCGCSIGALVALVASVYALLLAEKTLCSGCAFLSKQYKSTTGKTSKFYPNKGFGWVPRQNNEGCTMQHKATARCSPHCDSGISQAAANWQYTAWTSSCLWNI